ncbi:hypothetical protein B0H10DRAFT_491938 [Mycena sp. CBHHK59/15]|nr:hypothetical protein B0H10DRAFT_491938 [Mycena sp. CBHHK59/15]
MPSIRSQSNRTNGRKSISPSKVQGVLQANLGPPFHLVLDTASDFETPLPLSICFDLPKPARSPIKSYATEWVDSDSDSDEDTDLDASVHAQYISIPAGNPFSCPPPPPSFKASFELRNILPPVGCAPSPWAPMSRLETADDTQYIVIPAGSPFHAPPPPLSLNSAFDPRELRPRSPRSPSRARRPRPRRPRRSCSARSCSARSSSAACRACSRTRRRPPWSARSACTGWMRMRPWTGGSRVPGFDS